MAADPSAAGGAARQYRDDAAAFRTPLTGPEKYWYWSGLEPFAPPGGRVRDGGPGGQGWERKIARVQFLGRAPHDATWLLWAIITGQLIMAVCVWQLHVQPPVIIRNLGIAIAGLALPAAMAFLVSAWSDPTKRRTIGVLWDVGTFWPRSYHPLSPPCYTERAIPELQRRMWWLHDGGGRVMLVAHSQGTVLAAAALASRTAVPRVTSPALITFGSPLCKLYSWGFPGYVDRTLLETLEPGGTGAAERLAQLLLPDRPHRRIGRAGPVRAGGHQVDEEFLDPEDCYYVYGQPPPASQGHSGYWADPRVWDVINRVAVWLAGGPPPPPPPPIDNGSAAGTGPGEPPPELAPELAPAPEASTH